MDRYEKIQLFQALLEKERRRQQTGARVPTIFPTAFAQAMAAEAKLLVEPKARAPNSLSSMERLGQFQQFALVGTVDDALTAYFNVKLSKDQVAVLTQIHKLTKTWAPGHVVSELLHRLVAMPHDNKDVVEIGQTIMDQLETSSGETGLGGRRKRRQLLVKMAADIDVGAIDAD
jgi:hypothetical protein